MSIHVDYILSISDLPADCIEDCSASGPVDDAVEYWRRELSFTVDRDRAIACLRGYGAWEDEELAAADDDDIAGKILWLACGDFRQWNGTEDSPGGSDIFVLE